MRIAMPIFEFAPDALVAHKMNLYPGCAQKKMRDTYDYNRGQPQTTVIAEDDMTVPEKWRGQARGAQVVLEERGLWNKHRQVGARFLFSCGKAGCYQRGDLED